MAVTAMVAALLGLGGTVPRRSVAAGPSLSQLQSELSAQQAHEHALSQSIGSLSSSAASLRSQIAFVQAREAAVRADLDRDRAALAVARSALARERARLRTLRAALAWARHLLAQQLVSSYEHGQTDLMAVVLESNGFADLLDRVTFLRDAESQQQRAIRITRVAKALADREASRLAAQQAADQRLADGAATRVRALAGMNILLGQKQAALARALSAQRASLAASQSRSGSLRSQISQIEAQQAAAAAAARAAAAQSSAAQPVSGTGVALGPSGGWAIPYPIVLCESGGQNVPPNSAGASGYYQIMPATWKLYGGSGPAAYVAPKSEQDAVASRIWNGGAGASNWVCAGIVGIH